MIDSSKDKIGRQPLVDKIKYLIDTLPQDEHFCLALDGEWGSGKTFVMEMLRENLKEHSEYIVIDYDAWKNNFYSDPLIAILYCLLDGIKEYISILPEMKEKLKNGILKSLKSFGKDTLSAMKNAGGKIALFAHIIEGITNIVMQSGKLESHQKFADFRSYQSLLDDVKRQLNDITAAEIYEGKQTKLVIMVDEIDRCLPNEQLIVLERLHHLFEVKNCAVIVAVNKTSIKSVFERSYGDQNNTYFRKFFDYTFTLSMKYRIFLNNLIGEIINELNVNLPPENLLVKQDSDYVSQCLGNWCAGHGNFDNRECQRFVKIAKEICKRVPQGTINYGYFWFMFKMTFEKLYGKHFNVFKNGTASNLYSVDELDYMVKPLDRIATFPISAANIPIYNDMKINNLNYMLNLFAQRNNANSISSRSSLWCFQYGVKAICSMTCLEEIMGWIDNYKE